MSQKGLLNSCPDHVTINGECLELDNLVNWKPVLSTGIANLGAAFQTNKPFPHLVFEGLFSHQLLQLVSAEFDHLKWSDWARYDSASETKRASVPNARFGHATQLYFDTIYSGRFVNFISKLTGIYGLITDPACFWGGMHEIPNGGKFQPHLDFNKHPVTMLDNRLVFITYLNQDWHPSYGGALELWDEQQNQCMVKVEPVFGRSILFAQSASSLHGHPDPVNAPEGWTRRSVAAYYFTNGRPDIDTLQQPAFNRPRQRDLAANIKFRANVKNFVPPILYHLAAGTKRYFLRR